MITTGGTGGHIFPGLAVADRLRELGWAVFWLGTRDGMEARLVPRHGIEFEGIPFAGVRGKGLKRLLLGPFAILSACWRSLGVIRRRAPNVVLGLGGFASFPGGLMAVASNRPLVIHDSNAVAGLANRVLAFGADRVLAGFPQAFGAPPPRGFEWTGNPLRRSIADLPPPEQRFTGRTGPLRLLVVGGSLGAATLNARVPEALARLTVQGRPVVVHQAGEAHIEDVRSRYAAAGVDAQCVPFIDDMAAAYAAADVVVCRAGAITVSELAAAGVGSILVPLPGAIADEQTRNARFLADAGAALLEPQAQLTAERLASLLGGLDRPRLLAMAVAARALARPRATERVAEICTELAR
jgi:UDP-N-acetylglucosamine--N-acetylmuramyl-(pentapeptide) pyrophosphoryl-undecaprenol N-acetylglucosamine transferase